ncbi:MAG TPA: hypothetical protein VHK01_08580 [Lacipirellulaceae bacterium]|jgi:hypothetical protein|nr:hypothetical protein [Lacipirellulaceae bacterium]
MQPRQLVFALIAASLWTGLAGPPARSHGTQNSAVLVTTAYQRAQATGTSESPLACYSLEDDAADDLRLSLWGAPAVVSTLQLCARSDALHSFAPVFRCLQTPESQHIVLQV